MTATSSYHEGGQGTWVLYDLQDASAWKRAGDELAAWGKERAVVHRFGPDHVLVEYRAGGLADLQEPA